MADKEILKLIEGTARIIFDNRDFSVMSAKDVAKQILSGLDMYMISDDQSLPDNPIFDDMNAFEIELSEGTKEDFRNDMAIYSRSQSDMRKAKFIKVIPLAEIIEEVE